MKFGYTVAVLLCCLLLTSCQSASTPTQMTPSSSIEPQEEEGASAPESATTPSKALSELMSLQPGYEISPERLLKHEFVREERPDRQNKKDR